MSLPVSAFALLVPAATAVGRRSRTPAPATGTFSLPSKGSFDRRSTEAELWACQRVHGGWRWHIGHRTRSGTLTAFRCCSLKPITLQRRKGGCGACPYLQTRPSLPSTSRGHRARVTRAGVHCAVGVRCPGQRRPGQVGGAPVCGEALQRLRRCLNWVALGSVVPAAALAVLASRHGVTSRTGALPALPLAPFLLVSIFASERADACVRAVVGFTARGGSLSVSTSPESHEHPRHSSYWPCSCLGPPSAPPTRA